MSNTTKTDIEGLFLSGRDVQMRSEPFVYGYVDDYLDSGLFDMLNASFPAERIMGVSTDPPSVWGDLHPAWLRLFDRLSSGAFLSDLDEVLGGILGSNPADRFFLRFMLSRMQSGEWLEPHTDNPTKAVTLILFFGNSDWKPEYGGGTDIYEPKLRILRRNPHSIEVPFAWMRRVDTIDFAPNRLSFVVKSATSWHGVRPIRCPAGMTRNRLRITVEFVEPVEGSVEYTVSRFFRRSARKVIRRWMSLSDHTRPRPE